jgi:RimJ/RimL family protein N-acetyltransferase
MELRDGDLLLRSPSNEYLPALVEACQDEELGRFIPGFPSPYREADARRWLGAARASQRSGERLALQIVDGESSRLLGAIEVRLGEVGSIGYWVRADARGRGVASRALALLARWALTEGGVERLELTTHPENIASQRVAENAGFRREGVLRDYMKVGNGRRDSVMFSLLPSDLVEPR